MSLSRDLLKQARILARKEPKKPLQASLRRSVSASYYAIFHLLVDEATSMMLPGSRRGNLRGCLARTFRHSSMKNAAAQFASNSGPVRLSPGFDPDSVQQELKNVAEAFVELQEARHNADYNLAKSITRREALDLVELTEETFRNWYKVKGTLQADAFLLGLLVYTQIQG